MTGANLTLHKLKRKPLQVSRTHPLVAILAASVALAILCVSLA